MPAKNRFSVINNWKPVLVNLKSIPLSFSPAASHELSGFCCIDFSFYNNFRCLKMTQASETHSSICFRCFFRSFCKFSASKMLCRFPFDAQHPKIGHFEHRKDNFWANPDAFLKMPLIFRIQWRFYDSLFLRWWLLQCVLQVLKQIRLVKRLGDKSIRAEL